MEKTYPTPDVACGVTNRARFTAARDVDKISVNITQAWNTDWQPVALQKGVKAADIVFVEPQRTQRQTSFPTGGNKVPQSCRTGRHSGGPARCRARNLPAALLQAPRKGAERSSEGSVDIPILYLAGLAISPSESNNTLGGQLPVIRYPLLTGRMQ
jgi:hypothetical protein